MRETISIMPKGFALCQVVIGTQIQAHNLVVFGALGGGHNHRNLGRGGIAAQMLENFDAAHAGQHDVKQYQLGKSPAQGIKQTGATAEAFRLKPGGPQGINHQFTDAFVIFHTINHNYAPNRKP